MMFSQETCPLALRSLSAGRQEAAGAFGASDFCIFRQWARSAAFLFGGSMFILYSGMALIIGFLLDLLIGDPMGWPHIVRGFGALIAGLEKLLYPMKNKHLAGDILVVLVLFICTVIPVILVYFTYRWSPFAYLVLESLLCWQILAVKSLKVESRKVYTALEESDLEKARQEVSMIVGRDTESLDEAGVTRAAVETVAENASDGVGAPLFYMMLGGAALGCFYKAANTMDSMVGYQNERYLDFGRCAAKLDDVLNFIPARLSAWIMIFSAKLCGMDHRNAKRIYLRDRRNHASPNSAHTEAVMAGALGLRLAGDAWYFGKLHKKPYIGDETHPIEPKDILRSHRILYAMAVIFLLLALIERGILYALL